MEKPRSRILITSISVIVVASALFFVFPTISQAQVEEKTFVTHGGGVIKTSGEVIDPVYAASSVDFDPDKFLREFNYGRVSQLEDGSTLREFTIITEDNKGFFFNLSLRNCWKYKEKCRCNNYYRYRCNQNSR